MSRLVRYALFQLPGFAFAALLVAGLWAWAGLPGWAAGLALAVWVAKDAALYPLLRRAYEVPAHGVASLVGRRGLARRRLAPHGVVVIGAELWRAETADGTVIEAGAAVVVRRARGLTLYVAAEEDPQGSA